MERPNIADFEDTAEYKRAYARYYRSTHSSLLKEQRTRYYFSHRDEINEKKKAYNKTDDARLLRALYRDAHKDTDRVVCACGVTLSNKSRLPEHYGTKKHQKRMG